MDTFAKVVQLQLSKSQNCDPKPAGQGHPESYSTLAKNRQGRPESRLDLGPRMLEIASLAAGHIEERAGNPECRQAFWKGEDASRCSEPVSALPRLMKASSLSLHLPHP